MNNTKTHTPGPWEIFPKITNPDGVHARDACVGVRDDNFAHGIRPICNVSDESNAHLIAAAPEMLEALRSLMQPELQIEATPGGYCIFRFTPEQVASARAAIKKAEGA